MAVIKLQQSLDFMKDKLDQKILRPLFYKSIAPLSTQLLTSAALAKTGAASATVNIGSACTGLFNGSLLSIATATLPALTGPVQTFGTSTQVNVFVFSVDSSGNLYTTPGTPGATLSAVQFPDVFYGNFQKPNSAYVTLGFLIVNLTSSTFTPGTTAVDAANVTPTYINTVGIFDPTALL